MVDQPLSRNGELLAELRRRAEGADNLCKEMYAKEKAFAEKKATNSECNQAFAAYHRARSLMGEYMLQRSDEIIAALSAPSETEPSLYDELPLRCSASGGALNIRIGVNVLAFATEHCPDLWDGEKDRGRFKVSDPETFAKEVERAINHEDEVGGTMLTRMLDAAVLEAIEQGAEGVEGE